MSRVRLTSRTAEDLKAKAGTQVSDKGTGIDNDPYDINGTGHSKGDPKIDQYAKGDPSAWAEDVNEDNPAKDDSKREPSTGHAPLIDKHAASEAIASAKKLEEKAVKCIIAAQRILPGAPESMLEKQAAILMNLPDEGLNATLAHQEDLAKMIGKSAKECAKDDDEDEDKKKKEATEAEDAAKKKLEELKKEASMLEKKIEAGQNDPKFWYGEGQSMSDVNKKSKEAAEEKTDEKKDEKDAAVEEKTDEKKDEKDAAVEEKADEKKDEKDAAVEEKADEKKDEKDAAVEEKTDEKKDEKEASDATILDDIFGLVTASETKKGATKISGMVKKQASEQVDELASIWRSDPDVSKMF